MLESRTTGFNTWIRVPAQHWWVPIGTLLVSLWVFVGFVWVHIPSWIVTQMIPHRNDACMCHHDASCLSIMSDLNNCNGTLPTASHHRQLRSPQSDPLSESSSLIFLGKHLLRLHHHHHHQPCGLCTFQLWHSNLLASWWLCPPNFCPCH